MLGGQWGQRYLCCRGNISAEFRKIWVIPLNDREIQAWKRKKQQNKNKTKNEKKTEKPEAKHRMPILAHCKLVGITAVCKILTVLNKV